MKYPDPVLSIEDITFPLPEEPSCAFCSVPDLLKWLTFSTHADLTEHYKARHPERAPSNNMASEYESTLEEFEVYVRWIEERDRG